MANEDRKIQRDDLVVPHASETSRQALDRAKARAAASAAARVPPLSGTRRFDDVDDRMMQPAPGASTPPFQGAAPTLSKSTQDGLRALAAATVNEGTADSSIDPQSEQTSVPPVLSAEKISSLLACDDRTAARVLELLNPDGGNEQARKAIEARLVPVDLGQFLMNGVVSQSVPIIPPKAGEKRGGLVVSFQTVLDGIEAHVDRLLADEAVRIRHVRAQEKVVDSEMSQREYIRRQNEYALAVHVKSYMGTDWPPLTNAHGVVDEAAIATRIDKVRQIPSPLMQLLLPNLGWFLERVQRVIDAGVLGNG